MVTCKLSILKKGVNKTMAQQQTVGTHKTTVARDNNVLMVTYHNTVVVKVTNNRYVTLNTGGWYTNTTKTRMNQASNQYGLRFSVFQVDFAWYVSIGDDMQPYYDGIVIDVEEGTISRKLKDIN